MAPTQDQMNQMLYGKSPAPITQDEAFNQLFGGQVP